MQELLSTGGSNSITLSQGNLPNVKVSVDSFSVTVSPHYHSEGHACWEDDPNAFGKDWTGEAGSLQFGEIQKLRLEPKAGGGSTRTASPQTSALGKGTAITIQPNLLL